MKGRVQQTETTNGTKHNNQAVPQPVREESENVSLPISRAYRVTRSPTSRFRPSHIITLPGMSLLHNARSPGVHRDLLPPNSEVIQGCKALMSSYLQLGVSSTANQFDKDHI